MPFDPWVEVHVGLGGAGIQKSYAVTVQASPVHTKLEWSTTWVWSGQLLMIVSVSDEFDASLLW
jgi:hypothetical protein